MVSLALESTTNTTMELSPAALAEQYVKYTNKSVFLTGKAGTGKTTLLHKLRSELIKNHMVVAPTGIAAINAKGTTLHSQFGLPIGTFIPDPNYVTTSEDSAFLTPRTMFKHTRLNEAKRVLIRELELLIIDEVSMLRADLLDCLDVLMRSVRQRRNLPFGGVQVLFIGDMMQLPPVVKDHESVVLRNYYKSPFFFDAKVIAELNPIYIELDKIYRQSDQTFISLLNNLRNNKVTNQDIELLNSKIRTKLKDEELHNVITLTTHNYTADELNSSAIEKLDGKVTNYQAEIEGDFPENLYPIESTLQLKVGAQVMFVKNDTSGEKRYFNGKIGKIVDLGDVNIKVQFEDNSSVYVVRHNWDNIKYVLNTENNELEEKVMGTFLQFPLRLAWAITVHKSQGLTFEKAILDVNKAFAPGQVYVALSRLTSLDGLILRQAIQIQAIPQSNSLKEHEDSKMPTTELSHQLEGYTHAYVHYLVLSSFKMQGLLQTVMDHQMSYPHGENSTKQQYSPWAIELVKMAQEFIPYAEKFDRELTLLLQHHDYDKIIERCKMANLYFVPKLQAVCDFIIQHLTVLATEKGAKQYMFELADIESAFYRQIIVLHKLMNSLDVIIFKNPNPAKVEIKSSSDRMKAITDALKNASSKGTEDFKNTWKKKKEPKLPKEKKPKVEKVQTHIESYHLLQSGMSINQVATTRNLTEGTIVGHIARLIEEDKLEGSKYMAGDKLAAIKDIYPTCKDEPSVSVALKAKLGDEFSYGDIKLALAILSKTSEAK